MDGRVKAVVLRIDSPGGDALTSELIWRRILKLRSVKPVVASMVDVAASGGYFLAMGTNAIVAEDTTITGSIGVVAVLFKLRQLFEKIGLNGKQQGVAKASAQYPNPLVFVSQSNQKQTNHLPTQSPTHPPTHPPRGVDGDRQVQHLLCAGPGLVGGGTHHV